LNFDDFAGKRLKGNLGEAPFQGILFSTPSESSTGSNKNN